MLFNSYGFIFVFLPATMAGCWIIAKFFNSKFVIHFLILSSFVFYSLWDFRYLPLLLLSMTGNYLFGMAISRTRSRNILAMGITFDLLLLGFFKYMNFFINNVNAVSGLSVNIPVITLPLGISFFTFTQIAFLVDSFRGETEKYEPGMYGLFVSIFPHLIAGPILYHKNIIPQFERLKKFRFSAENVSRGAAIFTMGLFKKVVIADKLAPIAELTFGQAGSATLVDAWAGALAYTFQLYFDFSGYSEMAIGLGLLFNIKLPVNFNSPYKAVSHIDFWRRWHITLSDFLKRYLYIPLGGSRRGEFAKMRNLFITMLLCGLWHGAGWTFIVWGAMHGFLAVLNHMGRKIRFSLPRTVSWFLTFTTVVLAWVVFRAETLADAGEIIKAMFGLKGTVFPLSLVGILGPLKFLGAQFGTLQIDKQNLLFILFLLLCVCILPNPIKIMERFRPTTTWAIVISCMFVFILMNLNNITEFLYFQF